MHLDFKFFFNSILLGLGLAMDAFSVSMANGLHEPNMRKHRMCGIAGVFSAFQFIMPMIGWVCVHTITQYFTAFEKLIPWIALVLLLYIGGMMLKEGIQSNSVESESPSVGLIALLIQGIATSIDALSVGFTIANYDLLSAFICCALIAVVTFLICFAGVVIGQKFGTKLSRKASIMGGIILIFIGIEIFLTGIF